MHRCLPSIAAELFKRAGFRSDLRRAVEALKAEADAGRSIVLFGAGERGRALARACLEAGVAVAHWIDDHPGAKLEHCGTRTTRDHLTADHTLVITPDAPEAILQRLERTPAQVLLLRDLIAHDACGGNGNCDAGSTQLFAALRDRRQGVAKH